MYSRTNCLKSYRWLALLEAFESYLEANLEDLGERFRSVSSKML